MGIKKRTTLTIDSEIITEAHEIGLNISKISENALKIAIESLKQTKSQNESKSAFLGEASFDKEGSMEPRAGFDPATNSLQGCRSTGLSHRGTQSLRIS